MPAQDCCAKSGAAQSRCHTQDRDPEQSHPAALLSIKCLLQIRSCHHRRSSCLNLLKSGCFCRLSGDLEIIGMIFDDQHLHFVGPLQMSWLRCAQSNRPKKAAPRAVLGSRTPNSAADLMISGSSGAACIPPDGTAPWSFILWPIAAVFRHPVCAEDPSCLMYFCWLRGMSRLADKNSIDIYRGVGAIARASTSILEICCAYLDASIRFNVSSKVLGAGDFFNALAVT